MHQTPTFHEIILFPAMYGDILHVAVFTGLPAGSPGVLGAADVVAGGLVLVGAGWTR